MKTVTLRAREDSELGGLGLIVVGMTSEATVNPATDGLTLAHDLIEHVNGVSKIGSIDDELEALGAIWYVRGQWGELRRNGVGSMYSVEQNIASEVSRMFRDFFYGAHVDLSPIRTRACEADDAFRAVIEHAVKDARAELDSEDADDAAAQLRDYLAVCLPRMRIGYRKARNRYESRGPFAANNLFWSIAEAVEPYVKPEYEGAEYRLTYGFDRDGNAKAHCEEFYPENWR